ncbi:MAG: DUF1573 domain-containing protein [Pseudoflavonifractor sp.]|nr:DUF1573 domain-containing protein [Pseudoflavonifractor sp.]
MKTVYSAIIALAVSATISAQPRVEWLETEHDFGAFDEDCGKVSCVFKGVNRGDEPLVVLAVRTNCGCTASTVSGTSFAPGDTLCVTATYDAVGRPGRFTKRVYVDTNTDPSRSTLTVKGSVIGAANTVRSRYPVDAGVLKLRTAVVPFGEVKKGKAKMAFIEGYNMSSDSITPSWSTLPGYITMTCAPKVVPPGERLSLSVYYNTAFSDAWGLSTDTISIIPDHDATPFPVTTTIIVSEDFSRLTPGQMINAPHARISDESLDFGRVERGKVVTASFTIENTGKDPLLIRRVTSLDPGVTLHVDKTTVKKGKRATVRVSVDTSKTTGDLLNSRATVITNDPDHPQAVVRLVGQYDR